MYYIISWRSHGGYNFATKAMRLVHLHYTPQLLRVLRLSNSTVDRCSWLFQWARILFVVAPEVGQEALLVESESWQQELDAGIQS